MRLQPGFLTASVAAALLATFSGCGGKTTPRDALWGYFHAIAEGNLERAFDSLTAESRRKLDAIGAAMPGAPRGLDVFRASMTTGGPAAVPWITPGSLSHVSIDPVRQDAASATLRVSGPLGSSEVRLKMEDGRWRLELDV